MKIDEKDNETKNQINEQNWDLSSDSVAFLSLLTFRCSHWLHITYSSVVVDAS